MISISMKTALLAFFLLFSIGCQAQPVSQPQLKTLNGKALEKTYSKIDGIVVKQGENMLIEEYFNAFKAEKPHDLRSSFKSITSLLTGIAIDQQLLTLDDSLGQFFPELKEEAKKKIRVRHLLEMRSGLNCEEFYDIGPDCENEMWESEDWIAYCLSVEVKGLPGLNFSYSSNDPMIMGEVISRASGMTIMDFAKQYLFAPLEIKDYKWTLSPKGRGMTAGSFYMKPMDMLKIIELVSDKGKWKGKQIVSEAWITLSTTCEIPLDFSFTRYSRLPNAKYTTARYGFFWYQEPLEYKGIKTEVLFASGNGGQYMMVLPDYDAKVVFTGSAYGNWRGKYPFEILLKYIIPMLEKR